MSRYGQWVVKSYSLGLTALFALNKIIWVKNPIKNLIELFRVFGEFSPGGDTLCRHQVEFIKNYLSSP